MPGCGSPVVRFVLHYADFDPDLRAGGYLEL
jgi:hypothetical protein